MDQQKMILRAVWRKAYEKEGSEGLEIPCQSDSDATKLRFALYNAVRGVREGKETVDDLLREAVENCTVGRKPGQSSTLLVQRKVMTKMMQTIAGILGDSPELIKTPEQVEMESSQALLLEKLQEQGTAPSRSTPYYTR